MLALTPVGLADHGAARLLVHLQGAARLITDAVLAWEDPAIVRVPPGCRAHLAADRPDARVLEIAAAPGSAARLAPELVSMDTIALRPMPEHIGFRAASARWFDAPPGPSIASLIGDTVYGPGGLHELHRHPGVAEVLYVLSSSGTHLSRERSRPIGKGDLVAIQAGEWHGFVAGPAGADVAVVFPGAAAPSQIPSELFSAVERITPSSAQ